MAVAVAVAAVWVSVCVCLVCVCVCVHIWLSVCACTVAGLTGQRNSTIELLKQYFNACMLLSCVGGDRLHSAVTPPDMIWTRCLPPPRSFCGVPAGISEWPTPWVSSTAGLYIKLRMYSCECVCVCSLFVLYLLLSYVAPALSYSPSWLKSSRAGRD